MGSADRIEREKQQKRARILDAARELFIERGVEAVTLREIAQKIEYSTTAIYVQFADKAALVDAMLQEDFGRFSKGLEAAAAVEDPVERLGVLHEAYIDFALRMPHHYRLLFLTPPMEAKHKREQTSPAGIEGYRVLLATLDECMRTKRLRSDLDDPDAVAQIVWGTVHGLVSLQIVLGAHVAFHWRDRATLSRQCFEIVVHGLLRDPADIKRAIAKFASRTKRKR
jgi:AcrR family transcriptional regulator